VSTKIFSNVLITPEDCHLHVLNFCSENVTEISELLNTKSMKEIKEWPVYGAKAF
jgi:hypothetical protein